MTGYALNTKVPVDHSKSEIERTLGRYGAESFAYATKTDAAMVEFQMKGKRIRFIIPMPVRPSEEGYGSGVEIKRHEQSVRQKWRALALVIKAKLEAVASEITTLEQEFLAHIVLPGGKTFGDEIIPQLNKIYETGKVPALTWGGKT